MPGIADVLRKFGWRVPGPVPRFLAGTAVSAGLLALLVYWLRPNVVEQYWHVATPAYALPALLFFSGSLLLRAVRLRLLAGPSGAGTRLSHWLLLSARHQLVFTLLPSGLGDAGYPLLAGRLVGSDLATSARVLLTYRSQDLFALGFIGAMGVTLHTMDLGISKPAVVLFLAGSSALLYWSAELVRFAAQLCLAALSWVPAGAAKPDRIKKFLTTIAESVRPPNRIGWRLFATILAIISWILAAISVWFVFAIMGTQLDVGATMIVIAGLNLIGLLAAFTIAGFGFGEGGLAVLLLALGFGTQPAIAISLLVRPSILAMAVLSCLLIEGLVHLARRATT